MATETENSRRMWQAGARSALWVMFIATILASLPRTSGIRLDLDLGAQLITPFLGLVLFVRGTAGVRHPGALLPPTQSWPVSLVGLGLLCDAAAQIITLWYYLILHRAAPSPSWSDAASLSAYLVFLLAILVLQAPSARTPSGPRVLLDALLIVTALVTVSWPLILGPTVLHSNQTPFAAAVAAAYPLSDLLLLACLLVQWSHSNDPKMGPILRMFTLALGSLAVVDSIVEYLDLHGRYTPGSVLDAGWLLAPLLATIGAKALREMATVRAEQHRTAQPSMQSARFATPATQRIWQILLPYALLPPAGMVLLSTLFAVQDRRLVQGTLVGTCVLVALVVARQVITLVDNAVLYRTLEASQQQLRTVITHTPVSLFAVNRHGTITLAEGPGIESMGVTRDALLGRPLSDVYAEDTTFVELFQRALTGEAVAHVGATAGHVFDSRLTPLFDSHGAIAGVIGVALDVTERYQAERRVQESEQRYRSLFAHHPDAVFSLDRQERFLSANGACERLSGYSIAALMERRTFTSLLVEEDRAQAHEDFNRTLTGVSRSSDVALRHASGRRVEISLTSIPIVLAGEVQGVFGIARDVTAHKRAQEALAYQALHDALTGLPNRTFFQNQLERNRELALRARQHMALLLLDLDRFKEVNDTFGHQYGDMLLQQTATRLTEVLRGGDVVARLGGDEFAVLLPHAGREQAVEIAGRIKAALEAPFVLDGHRLHVVASLGIALSPDHGTDSQTLLRRADVAMYVSKRGNQPYEIYTAEHDGYSLERLAIIEDLRNAITAGQLTVYYQPQVTLTTGELSGVEALARWIHPTRGAIAPDIFVPLAEQAGLMGLLTTVILESALRQSKAWAQAGHPLPIAINLSVSNLRDPGLIDILTELLQRYDVAPDLLRLELTESTVMTDPQMTLAILTRLSAFGLRVSIDDFGKGYSSLAYLKRLPIDELKIDRDFVQHMDSDENDTAIVASTVGLGHSLGLRVVAEGVEDSSTLDALARLGCDIAQGYYLSRPLPADEVLRWRSEHTARRSPATASG